MSAHTSILGVFEPGDGWLFKSSVGVKYLLLLALAVPPIFIFSWWATLAALILVLAALLSSGLGLRKIFSFGGYIWFFLGLLFVYQILGARLEPAFVTPGNMLLAILAARMLTLTTSTADLLDALTRGLQVLKYLRINPDAVALMVALMLRSIPFLAGSIEDARAAARARGKERNLALLLTPAVVNAVAYAQRTGEALHARGLPDEDA
ncbi:MAG: CbiQ family ECF transporter T component [Propionibacteriaceae bacterium]|nr:CbiQ family ECF transporter T component [Propionibacteriaceae bacterium]